MAKDKWFYNEQKKALADHLAQPNGTLYAQYQGQMGDMVAEVLNARCPRSEPWRRESALNLIRRLADDSRFQVMMEGPTYTVVRWAGQGTPNEHEWGTKVNMPPRAAPRLDKIEARLDEIERRLTEAEDTKLDERLTLVEEKMREWGL